MKTILLILLGITNFCLSPLGFCQTINGQKPSSPVVTITCPPINSLKKNPKLLTWSAPGGFKSYETSFVNRVTNFLGAQWVGANVGQVTCIYQGEDKTTFPVLLVYGSITLQPSGGQWSKNSQASYLNCITSDPQECPFKVRTKPQQLDLFRQLEELKSDSPLSNDL